MRFGSPFFGLQNFCSEVEPNSLTLIVFLKENLKKVNLEKRATNYQACRELISNIYL